MTSVVALIPARAGSQRVKGKNVRPLAGVPLLTRKIDQALRSEIFTRVIVSTDSEEYAELARKAGALPMMRPEKFAAADSPDVLWVQDLLSRYHLHIGPDHWSADVDDKFIHEDAFSILRCTSPFFGAKQMQWLWRVFQECQPCDSVRTVRPSTEHPGKQWFITDANNLIPALGYVHQNGVPWHSNQTGVLPQAWIQAGAMEVAWSRVGRLGSIAGDSVRPFKIPNDYRAIDINTERDWARAEAVALEHPEWL